MSLIKRYGLSALFFLMLILQISIGYTAPSKNQFNLAEANKRFDQINIRLSTQNLNIQNLEAAVEELEALQAQANLCVEQNEHQLQLILSATPLTNNADKQIVDKQKYIFSEKRLFEDKSANCRLFVLRTKDSIVAFKETISKLGVNVLLSPRTAIWDLFSNNPLSGMSAIKSSVIKSHLYWPQLSASHVYASLLGLLVFAVIVGVVFASFLKSHYHQKSAELVLTRLTNSVSKFVLPILFFGFSSIFFAMLERNANAEAIFEHVSFALLLFSLLLGVLHYIFMTHNKNKFIFYSLIVFFSYLLVCYFIRLILLGQQLDAVLIDFASMFYLIILSMLSTFCLCVAINALSHLGWRITLHSLVPLYLFSVIVIACLGFLDLAQFLLYALLSTVALMYIGCLLVRLIQAGVRAITLRKTTALRSVFSLLNIKPNRNLIEVTLVQLALYIIIASCFVVLLMEIWDFPQHYIYRLKNILIEGFAFSSVSISLLSIVYALCIFSIIHIIGRALSAMLSRRHKFRGELDTQSAVASIVTYVSFSIALIASLLVLGINFTGLAIIIGALSVGIGLGLQTIVNNFVSGLVLLIEKPIRSGDRILIGDVEGFVKKVRIRSTQIMTMAKEDVIIPNSDLITKTVTNYMFRNTSWRVVTRVGVAYGSNIELVKTILMDVAKQHELVLQDPLNMPAVFFKEFGNSSLIFELWCVIQDVNRKYLVSSDLNFKIDHAFREAGITIAFPQRDVHIKSYTQMAHPTDVQST